MLCAAFVLLAILRPAAGEVFLLRSGGRIEGDLVNADENPRTSYVISLPNGGQLTLDAAVVEKVQPVRPELAEYEKVRRQHPDTVQGQLQMADWCRDHNLPAQRKTHLERVLQLDPDQADARRLLGYRKVKDKWMTLEEEMADKGKVKRRDGRLDDPAGGGTSRQSQQATQGRDRVGQEDQPLAEVARRHARPSKATKNLRAINDPMAIVGLAERLKKDTRTDARLIYVEVLARINHARGPRPAGHLCDRRSGGRGPPFLPG